MANAQIIRVTTTHHNTGLSARQRRLLAKCRRDPKPLSIMLRECRIGMTTFTTWRSEPHFARAFRRTTAGMSQDSLTDFRLTFAMCSRLLSAEVSKILSEEKTAEELNAALSRVCFDAIKLGMTAFVPKRGKRQPFPYVDPALYARLVKAQQAPKDKPAK